MHVNGLQLCQMRGVPWRELSAETVSRHDTEQPPDTGSELLTRHSHHNFAATCHGQFQIYFWVTDGWA